MRQVIGRKRSSIWRAYASLVLVLTVSATVAQERRLDPGVEREIQEVNKRFFEALDRRDAGAAEGLLSEDYLAVLPGRRIGAGVVFDSGELRELFKGFEVLRYEEVEDVADYGLEQVRLVRLVARKQ